MVAVVGSQASSIGAVGGAGNGAGRASKETGASAVSGFRILFDGRFRERSGLACTSLYRKLYDVAPSLVVELS
jgi:hypothetical protein